jgi:hypothetical protein
MINVNFNVNRAITASPTLLFIGIDNLRLLPCSDDMSMDYRNMPVHASLKDIRQQEQPILSNNKALEQFNQVRNSATTRDDSSRPSLSSL